MSSQEIRQFPGSKPRFFRGYLVVVAAICIMVSIWGAYFSFGVFFRPMLDEFGWTSAMTSGAFSVSILLHGLLGIAAGGLNDRFGPRLVVILSGLILGLGYFLMSLIGAIWQLYLFYGVIIGIGMGGAFVPLLSTVARWFATRRSLMTGIVISGVGAGQLIGPPVATRFISAYDWRTSFIILGGLVLVIVVLAAQFLKRDPSRVWLLPYGQAPGEEQGLKSEATGFSLREAVRTRQFWLVLSMFFCLGFSLFAITVHIVPHAIELEISAIGAANILATIGGTSIVGNFVLGDVADRIGNRLVFIIGFIMMVASLFWLVPARDAWILYLFATVFGFFSAGCGVSESPLVAALFGLRSHGLIFGFAGIGFTSGAAIGPLVVGHIFDVADSYQAAFLVCAIVGIVGLILAALLKPTKTTESTPA